MKLNPTKCTFNLDLRKSLDFIVLERGIEANTDKISTVMNMNPPRNIGET